MNNEKYKYTINAIFDILKFIWANRHGGKNIYVIRSWYIIAIALIGTYSWAVHIDSNGNWNFGISTAILGYFEVLFFFIVTLGAIAILYITNRKEYAKQTDIDVIKDTTDKTLQNTQKMLFIMESSGSSVIQHLIPDLCNAIEQLKVKSAYNYLTTIKTEVKIHSNNDHVLLATTEYYLGMSARFINGKKCSKHFSEAYRLMTISGSMEPEILEAMIYVSCVEKKYDLAHKYANELRQLSPNSYWTVIPQLIESDNLIEVGMQIPTNIDRELAIATIVMLGGSQDHSLGVDINNYQVKIYDNITTENFPLWILNLSVALSRFCQNFTITRNIHSMYTKNTQVLHEMTEKYLQALQETEIENLLPDTIFVNALTGYFKDQNPNWLQIMKNASYSNNIKEIYHLGYAIMLCDTNRDADATTLLKNYGDDSPSSILNMRLQIVAPKMDVEEMKEVFKCACERQCPIPDHLLNLFLSITRIFYDQMGNYPDNLNIENPQTKRAFTEYLKYLRKEDGDINWLCSVEEQLTPFFLPFLACIYKDKISLKKGVDTLRKCVDRKVLDLRSILLIEFMSLDQSYTSELYHLLKELRQSSDDINNYDVQLMNKELQLSEQVLDYQNSKEVTSQMMAIIPDNDSLIVHHIIALDGCGGYEDKIKTYKSRLLKATLTNQEVIHMVTAYQTINESEFALELLFQNIKRTNDQVLKDFYIQKQLHPDFNHFISQEKDIVEILDSVTIKIGDEIKDIEITSGSVYEDLVGKNKGDVCQLDIKGTKSISILEIHTKYHRLLKDVYSELQNNNSSKTIKMFSTDDFDFKNDPLGSLMKMAGKTEESREREKVALLSYQQGEMPLMSFVKESGVIADLYDKLFGDFAICTCPNIFLESFFQGENDINSFDVALDISSLIMLHEYDKKFSLDYSNKFYISKGVVNLIKAELKYEERGGLVFFPQQIQEKVSIIGTDSSKTVLWNKLKMLLNWIDSRCEVVVVEEKLNYKFDDIHSITAQIEMESLLLTQRGYLLLTEDWSYTKRFLNLIPSMSVYNWVSLTGKSHAEEYGQMMLELGNLGYPMTADYIVEQYILLSNNAKNNYNTCLSNIEKYPMSYEEVLKAGKQILSGIVIYKKTAGVTNLFVTMFKSLSIESSKMLIFRELTTNSDLLYHQCLLDALKICHPVLLRV